MSKTHPKVGIISLGCSKALVDSERILTKLGAEGYEVSENYDGADVVIVNTCGFLDSARAESLDAIGEAMAENGRVIVTGCLGLNADELAKIHPGVLAVTGPHQYEQVVDAVHMAAPPALDAKTSLVPPGGMRLTPRHYAYVKISEGCNHHCSFCIIPSIRGKLQSRPAADILDEAEKLAISGVKELLVISQDTGAYGVDLKHAASDWHGKPVKAHIHDLASALSDIGVWTRLHYVYPYPHMDSLVELMADGKILPYIDIPFQHASPDVLKSMRRPAHQEKVLERIKRWRDICPDLTILSTFIVGFPGEMETDFEYLLDWLEEAQLDRVGAFKYEDIEGAAANKLADHIDEDEKTERWERLMELQMDISAERLARFQGRTMDVLIDAVDEEENISIGRSFADSPEVDGVVYFEGDTDMKPGDMVKAEIKETGEYDMWAERMKG